MSSVSLTSAQLFRIKYTVVGLNNTVTPRSINPKFQWSYSFAASLLLLFFKEIIL